MVFVGGEDLTHWFDVRTVSVKEGFAARGDTARGPISIPWVDLHAGLVAKPSSGQLMAVYVEKQRRFEGPIVTVTDEFINPLTFRANIEAVDHTLRLDAHLVLKAEYPLQLAGERIKAILTEFCPEFAADLTHIEDGESVPAEGYDYESPSSVIDKLAEATDYHWYVDEHRVVHFFDEASATSPLSADYGNILDLDTNLEIGGVTVVDDWANLHNKVFLKDFSQRSEQKYTHKEEADGQQSFFKLPMPPWSVDDTRVWVNGVERQVVRDPLDGSPGSIVGVPGLAFACIYNWGIRMPTSDLPAAGDLIEVEYNYEVPNCVLAVSDALSIDEMKRREGVGSDGVHEAILSIPDMRAPNLATVYLYATSVLNREAWPIIRGSFTTFMAGWHAGQRFKLTSQVRDIYDIQHWVSTGRGDKVPLDVWVQTVTWRVVTIESLPPSVRLEYTVEFANRPFSG